MHHQESTIPAYSGVTKWLIALIVSLLVFSAKWVFGIQGSAGYALTFVGVFLIISCAAVLPTFVRRKRMHHGLINGIGTVVHWQMDEAFFAKAAERKRENQKQRYRAMLIFIGVLFFVISVVFLIGAWEDGGVATFLICMGIYALIVLFARIAPRVVYAKSMRRGKYAFVGEDSALIASELHIFTGKTTRFDQARYAPDTQAIFIDYRVLTRMGYTPYVAEIPVPDEFAEQAGYIVGVINAKHGQ